MIPVSKRISLEAIKRDNKITSKEEQHKIAALIHKKWAGQQPFM